MQKNKTPKHYQLIIKYISRYKQKNCLEDLFKAKDYIDILINNFKELGTINNYKTFIYVS